MGIYDYILLILICLWGVVSLVFLITKKGGSCCGGCSGCPFGDACEKRKKEKRRGRNRRDGESKDKRYG